MTEYLERLVRRLNPPSGGGPTQPAPITPSVPTAAAGAEPEESFEEVNDLTYAETASFKPAPVEGGIDPPSPVAARPTTLDTMSPPAGEVRPALPRAARHTDASVRNATPMTPDRVPTDGSAQPLAASSPYEPDNSKKTRRLTDTILVEKEAVSVSTPASLEPPSAMSASSRPGLLHQDGDDMRQRSQPDPSHQVGQEMHQEKKAPALETREEPIAPVSGEAPSESILFKPNQGPREHTTQVRQLSGQGEVPSSPPPMEPKETPTLYPSPEPAPRETPQPERPRLVIGRLHVEVVPPPTASAPVTPTAKPVRRMPSRTPGHQPVHSKLRFGLGQL